MPYTSFAAGAASNPNVTYEHVGFQADGSGTQVTANALANTKGSYVSLGTTAADWSEFEIYVAYASAGARLMFDVSVDGGSSVKCPNVFAWPGGTTLAAGQRIPIPMPVAAGAQFQIRMQATTGGVTAQFMIIGTLADGSEAPGFTTMTALNIDTAASRASATNVSFNETWVSQLDPTASAYGALLAVLDGGAAAGTSNQAGTLDIGVGPTGGGGEATIYRMPFGIATTGVTLRSTPKLIRHQVASGVRISAKADAAANPTDTVRVGLHGFS
jgi:hypothetical protein